MFDTLANVTVEKRVEQFNQLLKKNGAKFKQLVYFSFFYLT